MSRETGDLVSDPGRSQRGHGLATQQRLVVDQTPGGPWARRGAAFLVASLAFLPYAGILDAPFVFDDEKLVQDNETIRDFSKIPGTFNIFSQKWDAEKLRANYRPLRFLSYAIDYRITTAIHGESRPESLPTRVFHIHNVALHVLNALLLLGIGRVLLGDGAAALVLALLFALHPILTEAVTYISGRRDVLSTSCFLLALRVYLGRAGTGYGPSASGIAGLSPGPPGAAALILVPVLFVLGLLSKEMVVTLPAVILLVDLARRARFGVRRFALALVLWALALGFAAFEALQPALMASAPGGSREAALLTAPRYALRYLGLVLFPHLQSIDYSFDAIPVSRGILDPWTTWICIVLAAALVAVGLLALRRRRALPAIGILWFLGTLTPVLQIVPIPERFAERFLYVPSMGIFLLAAAGFAVLRRRSPAAAWSAAITVLVLLGTLTVLRNRDWNSPLELWATAARAQPRCARAHFGHGQELQKAGLHRDALRAFTTGLEILGDVPPAFDLCSPESRSRSDELLRWGQVLKVRALRAQSQGELGAESPESFRKAVEDYRWLLAQKDIDGAVVAEGTRYLVHRFNLANCLLGLSGAQSDAAGAKALRTEAAGEFRKVAAAEAGSEFARRSHYYLSKIARLEGRPDEELAELEEAFRITREAGDRLARYRLAAELSDVLIERKELDRAEDVLRASISEIQDLPERKHLLYRRSMIQDRRGDLTGAARYLEEALGADGQYGPALLTLAGIEENRGNLDRAEGLYRRLLAVAPGDPKAQKGLESLKIRREMASQKEGADGLKGALPDASMTMLQGLLDRGEGHFLRGELLAAGDVFKKTIEKAAAASDPEKARAIRARALRRLGNISRELREFQRAEKYLAEALDADPGLREALRDLGDLELRDLKNRQAAEDAYQKYLDGFPKGRFAEDWVYVNLASLIQDRDPARALDLFQACEKAGISSPVLKRKVGRTMGVLLSRLGRWEESLERLQEFLEASEAADEPAEAADRQAMRKFIDDEVLPHVKGGEDLQDRDGGSGGPGGGNR